MIKYSYKLICLIVIVVLAIILGIAAYSWFQPSNNNQNLPGQVQQIKNVIKLSTLKVSIEDIIKDEVNGKGIVARVRANAFISFDIEQLPMTEQGDTLFIQLPPEIIEIYEASDNGYQVLDVWSVRYPNESIELILSTEEENVVKLRQKQKLIDEVYTRGYVKRARNNAVNSLVSLFSKFKNHIIIIDQYPDGWRNNEPAPFSELKPITWTDN